MPSKKSPRPKQFPPCPYCRKRAAPPSKEDILAKWIARTIEADRKGRFTITGGSDFETRDERWYARGNIGFVTTGPCEHCNNRWMSDLETAAKPILRPLIEGEPRLITTSDQVIIAKWATKTVMNWEFFRRRTPKYFTHRERYAMFERQDVPLHVMFFIGRYLGEVAKPGIRPSIQES